MRWQPSICDGGVCSVLLDGAVVQVEAVCQRHQSFASDPQSFYATLLDHERRVNYSIRTILPAVPRLGFINENGHVVLKDGVLDFTITPAGELRIIPLIRLRHRERVRIAIALLSHPEWNAVLL